MSLTYGLFCGIICDLWTINYIHMVFGNIRLLYIAFWVEPQTVHTDTHTHTRIIPVHASCFLSIDAYFLEDSSGPLALIDIHKILFYLFFSAIKYQCKNDNNHQWTKVAWENEKDKNRDWPIERHWHLSIHFIDTVFTLYRLEVLENYILVHQVCTQCNV